MTQKYRLVTRSDFDGLVCAVLLKELDMLDEIKFVHPKDMQDGKVEVSARDITTNLPYVPGVFLAFDHHLSETHRVKDRPANHIIDADAPSAARVVYKHFGGKERFPRISDVMMAEVDKADAAQFTRDEILRPVAVRVHREPLLEHAPGRRVHGPRLELEPRAARGDRGDRREARRRHGDGDRALGGGRARPRVEVERGVGFVVPAAVAAGREDQRRREPTRGRPMCRWPICTWPICNWEAEASVTPGRALMPC